MPSKGEGKKSSALRGVGGPRVPNPLHLDSERQAKVLPGLTATPCPPAAAPGRGLGWQCCGFTPCPLVALQRRPAREQRGRGAVPAGRQ